MAGKNKYIIVVAWGRDTNDHWYPWLKRELESQPNSEVTVIQGGTVIEQSLRILNDKVGMNYLDENTYLIGHSVGCQQIIRWLATLDVKIGGILLVAGWMELQKEDKTPALHSSELIEFLRMRREQFFPWMKTAFDGKKVVNNAKKITVMISDNDEFVWKYQENKAKFLQAMPGCNVIIFPGKGHFMGLEEPQVLQELERLK